MNLFLWILQAFAVLMYGASGVMKLFFFDKVSHDVPSFGALPRGVWSALGVLELVCAAGLVVPALLHWHVHLVVVGAAILAVESLLFIFVHLKYREPAPIIMSAVLGALMAFVAYGRAVLMPLH